MIFTTQENLTAAMLAVPMELERIRAELQAGLQASQNATPVTGARYRDAGGAALAWDAPGRLVGWSVRAFGGPVQVFLRDGRDEMGARILGVIDLDPDQTETVWLGNGVSFGAGLFLERAGGGALQGAVWIGEVD